MTVLVPIHDRPAILPFFLRYYAKYGATRFVYILWMGKDNPIYPEIARMSEGYDWHMRPYVIDHACYQAAHDVEALNRARLEFISPEDWYIVADLDEFHYYDGMSFPAVVKKAEYRGYSTVWSVLVDRLAPGGLIPVLRQDLTLDEQFPMAANVMFKVGNSCQKVGLSKGNLSIIVGHHVSACFGLPQGETHHFKWHGPILAYLRERYEQQKKTANSVWLKEHEATFALMEHADWFNQCTPRPADLIGV